MPPSRILWGKTHFLKKSLHLLLKSVKKVFVCLRCRKNALFFHNHPSDASLNDKVCISLGQFLLNQCLSKSAL